MASDTRIQVIGAMTTTELIKTLAAQLEISQSEARRLTKLFFATVTDSLANDETLIIRDFGTFSTRLRKARTSFHPSKKRKMVVPPKVAIHFRPSKRLKEQLATKPEEE